MQGINRKRLIAPLSAEHPIVDYRALASLGECVRNGVAILNVRRHLWLNMFRKGLRRGHVVEEVNGDVESAHEILLRFILPKKK